jgi:hypothetical protein
MNKKGQSALEYLMTYGWALVVIVIVIAALFAFGIFNPPSAGTCTGLDKLAYSEHSITDSNAVIALMNGTGSDLADATVVVTIGGTELTHVETDTWEIGETEVFYNSSLGSLTSPQNVQIQYLTANGITHTETAICTFS